MKILFYTAEHLLSSDTSDTRYIHDELARHFDVRCSFEPDVARCRDADIIFCRFPKPANPTFLRQLVRSNAKLIINNPRAQLLHGTKRNVLQFPDLTAPTIVTTSAPRIRTFAEMYGPIVLKPLNRYKGEGVLRIDVERMSRRELSSLIADYVRDHGPPMVQPFLDVIYDVGDKRINIFRFEPVSAVVTFPAADSFICHEAAGGSAHAADLSARDLEIVRRITPFLQQNDLWWAAIDVIGPYLSEINIATPSMVWRADRAHGDSRGLSRIVEAIGAYEDEHARMVMS